MRTSAGIPFDRLRPGPRRVSDKMVLSLCFAALGQVGWLVLGFSSIFVFAFDLPALVVDLTRSDEGALVVPGKVVAVANTSMRINKVAVRRVSFTWELDRSAHRSDSFHTGDPGLAPGKIVDVIVSPRDPTTAVIRGMRRTVPSRGVVFVGVFPLVGLALALGGVRRGLRHARLLREGEPAKGKLVGQRGTGVYVNKQPVIEYTFSFRTRSGEERTASVKTSEAGKILDEREEPLFYDPRDPDRTVLLGSLPGDPRVDDEGNFTAPGFVWLRLIMPVVVVCAWAAGFAFFT